MTQEMFERKLYVLLVILSIALVVTAAGLVAAVVSDKGDVKSYLLPEQKTISVSGSASEFVLPDTASLSIGVLIQASTAKEASEKNAAVMAAVINALKSLGLQEREIQTSFLSLNPVYSYPKEDGAPTIVGYSASNNVQITTEMLDRLGDIVDKSVAAGANQVSGISFIISEEKQKQLRDKLLTEAVKDASDKADKLASNLNVRIVGVKTSSISEGEPPQPFAPAIAERAVTPVLPGESRATLSIQVTYIIE